MLQRDVNGNWRHPGNSYYPHKARLCVGWPGYLKWMKKVIAFLHVLNFRDTDGAFRIALKRNAPVRAYDFGGSAFAIDGSTISGGVKRYLVIDCGSASFAGFA